MTTTIAPPDRDVVPVLALAEARRLLTHPVMLTGFALWLLLSSTLFWGAEPRPLDVFEGVGTALSWTPGIFAILAGYLVATREQRAGSLDVLGALPAREPERVRALCVAALAPGLVGLVLNAGLAGVLLATDMFAETPSVAHLLQGPLTLVGAVLLGVLVAVWAPYPIAPAVAVVGMVGFHVAFQDDTAVGLLRPAVFWADWGRTDGELWDGYVAGSPGWHVVYVAGLCGLAAAAALVRVGRSARLVATGLGVLAVTVLAAVLQQP
jgi:hypothetical protein